ncbi:hypothetical protein WDZ92_38525, partial [Nostoc sp. NIES-2111]
GEEIFHGGVGAGGGLLGARQILVDGGDDADALHATPSFQLDLAEETAADERTVEHSLSMAN